MRVNYISTRARGPKDNTLPLKKHYLLAPGLFSKSLFLELVYLFANGGSQTEHSSAQHGWSQLVPTLELQLH